MYENLSQVQVEHNDIRLAYVADPIEIRGGFGRPLGRPAAHVCQPHNTKPYGITAAGIGAINPPNPKPANRTG